MTSRINTTRDISKFSQHITILKYHSWYLRQVSLQIMLLPILIVTLRKEVFERQTATGSGILHSCPNFRAYRRYKSRNVFSNRGLSASKHVKRVMVLLA